MAALLEMTRETILHTLILSRVIQLQRRDIDTIRPEPQQDQSKLEFPTTWNTTTQTCKNLYTASGQEREGFKELSSSQPLDYSTTVHVVNHTIPREKHEVKLANHDVVARVRDVLK